MVHYCWHVTPFLKQFSKRFVLKLEAEPQQTINPRFVIYGVNDILLKTIDVDLTMMLNDATGKCYFHAQITLLVMLYS